ncbi:hypothetical protein Sjap_024775 [Stephania japonica]|uniref:Uncharacterized protein n=1 Tax=Stephania japonica TaxID=461633 RepID=A0AAP0EL80_9MAGN
MSAPLASVPHFGAKKVPSRSTDHRSSSVVDHDRRISKNCILGLRKGAWSEEEDLLLKKCIAKWSLIAGRLRGRTANDVKNYWNTHLNKKVVSPQIKEAAKPHLETKKEAQLFRPRPRTFSKNSKWLKRDKAPHEVLVSDEGAIAGTPTMQFDKNTISWLEHILNHGEAEDQVGILDSAVEVFFKSSSSTSSVEDMEPKDSHVGTLSTRDEDIASWFDDELYAMKKWGALLES